MTLVLVLFSFFVLVSTLPERQDSKLVVMDSKTRKENPIYLVKSVDESLELTCELKNSTEEEISLKWILPFDEENRTISGNADDFYYDAPVVTIQNGTFENGSIRLFVSHLQKNNSGLYICSYSNNSDIFNHTVRLYVRPKKLSCAKKFECEDNQCISVIYKCDGIVDCRNKNDEDPEMCGDNACEGKVMCENGRCIPSEWCKPCDSASTNCTLRHRPDCCPPLYYPKGMPYADGTYPQRFNDFVDQPNMQHRYDINFLQTTIYTIIGCALVFMIIVTILGIAICRVHMKRSPPTHIPNNRRVFSSTAYHRAFTQEIGVYDLDIAVNRPDGLGLLVTYNINNGVQIVGSPIEPPPYSEVASLPPREGPPPPYTISQPYDGSEEMQNLRSGDRGSPPKTVNRFLRQGLPSGRVSSEPSLLNLNNRL